MANIENLGRNRARMNKKKNKKRPKLLQKLGKEGENIFTNLDELKKEIK